MIARVALAVLFALVLLAVGGTLLPREVQVERSIEIRRPVVTVHAVLARPETFPAWLPWSARDPGIDYRFSGPRSGVGARLDWSGDKRRVGTGMAEITDSVPGKRVAAHLSIEDQAQAETVFRIERIAGGARLTWSLETDLAAGKGVFDALVSRYFGLVFDRWAGGQVERGLANLKGYLEELPEADFSGTVVDIADPEPMDVLYVSRQGERSSVAAAGLAGAWREITAFMSLHEIEMTAQPMALTRRLPGGQARIDAAIPVRRIDVPPTGSVKWGRSPGGPSACTVHSGGYQGLAVSRARLLAWLAAHGRSAGPLSWEHYLSDPGTTPVDERVTRICIGLAD